jgi:predicted RNase H-like HicB family nuclease
MTSAAPVAVIPPIPPSSVFEWSTQVNYGTENSTIGASLKRVYNIEFSKGENGWIVVRCLDLPGLNTQGKDEKEATKNTVEAIELMEEELGRNKEFNLSIQYKFSG